MIFQIELAGKIIELHTLYDWTFRICSNYIVKNATPDYVVKMYPSDIEFERFKDKNGGQSDGYLESLAVYRRISELLLDDDIFLMHGSVLGINSQAVMFTAPSGTGKTTMTELWLTYIPESYIINGDKPLLRIDGEKALAYGTPWCGKENENTNCVSDLQSICFLERGEVNEIRKISAIQAVSKLMGQIYRPKDSEKMRKTVKLISALTKTVDFYQMTFRHYENLAEIDEEPAVLSCRTIFPSG